MFDWIFGRKPSKASLQGQKKVRIGGAVYTIRKLNPILDFTQADMPTIFSAYQSRRKVTQAQAAAAVDHEKAVKDMMLIVKAGLVEPSLSDNKAGITIEDIFRVPQHGTDLYLAIMDHTLNQFSGLRKVFFSMRIRREFYTALRGITAAVQAK